ncbi:MAG: PspC domain-containing protein [Barnesiella sp.]|nr:PspC domain-containing protein [Barnesiella sp.]
MRKLYRSNIHSIIAGVCGGIGEYFGIDPIIIRIFWAVLACSGAGIIAYILFWIFVPLNPDPLR